ncbi:MAG: tetratricopeptide repeat protein [Alphaproteobacteria bacterium]|nr:tetratricopeptide repeat protein [Alphaproteobacteria bacterium]
MNTFKDQIHNKLIQVSFEQRLHEISPHIQSNPPICFIGYCWDKEAKVDLVSQIEAHLRLAGIKTLIDYRDGQGSILNHIANIEREDINYVIYAMTQALIARLQSTASNTGVKLEIPKVIARSLRKPDSIIPILLDGDLHSSVPVELTDITYLDFRNHENYYLSVFKLLQRILPTFDLTSYIEEFKKQFKAIHDSSINLSAEKWGAIQQLELEDEKLTHDVINETAEILLSHTIKEINERKKRLILNEGSTFKRLSQFLFQKKKEIATGFGVIFLFLMVFLGLRYYSNSFVHINFNLAQIDLTSHSNLSLPRQDNFLNRPALLSQIESSFTDSGDLQTVALVGIGGAGKTTLACQYARQFKQPKTWKINAESKDSVINSYEYIAHDLAKTDEDKQTLKLIQESKESEVRDEKILRFIKERIQVLPNWFLIFDNLENISDIIKFYPTDPSKWGCGKILITTRNANIKNSSYVKNVIQIGALDECEKLELFLKITNIKETSQFSTDQQKQIQKFLNEIPPFPLDVCLAAYYIKATNISYEKYLYYLSRSDVDFSILQQTLIKDVSDYTKTRYNLIVMAIREILNKHKDFEDLLILISILDSQKIPKGLLEQFKKEPIVDNFIYHLKKYSLIQQDEKLLPTKVASFSIHRNTQELMLTYLTKILDLENNTSFTENITSCIEKHAAQFIEKEDLISMKGMKTHYEKFLSHQKLITENSAGTIGIILGYINYSLGSYTSAKELLGISLKKLYRNSTKNISRIAPGLIYLANAHWDLAEFSEAKKSLEKSIHIYKRNIPKDKTGLARALGDLGIINNELENFKDAETILLKTIEIYQTDLPNDFIGLAQAYIHLGMVYRNIGKYNNAHTSLERSILIYQKYLPENRIAYAWALSNLGNINKDMGKYKEAFMLYEQSLHLLLKYAPSKQVEIGRTYARLGNIYRELGNYTKSQECLEKSLNIYNDTLPENHVAFPWAMAHLSLTYRALANLEKAKDLIDKSLLIYKKNLSDNNIEVTRAKTYLARTLIDIGSFNQAQVILHACLPIYKQSYGKNHIETARIFYYMGKIWFAKNNLEKAENHFQQALRAFQTFDHTDAYLILEDLGTLYMRRSKLEEMKGNTTKALYYERQAVTYFNQAINIAETRLLKNAIPYVKLKEKLQNVL